MTCIDVLFDGQRASEHHIAMVSRPDIPSPTLRVEHIDVPGRDGSLTREDAYEDITISINFNLLEEENIKPLIREVKGFFLDKKTLQFTDDTVYYKIKSYVIGDTNNEIEEYGLFTVDFRCDPFQYELNTSFQSVAKGGKITNPGTYQSAPLIKIAGSGDGVLTVNGKEFRTVGQTEQLTIDSGLGIAYTRDFASERNDNVRGEPPMLHPGENTISWTGGITAVEINGRWRYV